MKPHFLQTPNPMVLKTHLLLKPGIDALNRRPRPVKPLLRRGTMHPKKPINPEYALLASHLIRRIRDHHPYAQIRQFLAKMPARKLRATNHKLSPYKLFKNQLFKQENVNQNN